ncbi:MAG: tyrosine-type recombinase/integrase [Acidobacteriota bacterium]
MKVYRRKDKKGKLLSPFYYFRFTYEGREYAGSTRTSDKQVAQDVLNKKYNEVVARGTLKRPAPKRIPTLEAFAQTYLAGYAAHKRTRKCDERMIRNSLLPAFGQYRLDRITPSMVEAWRNERLQAEKLHGKGTLSPASVRLEMALLKTILNLAIRDELLDQNPVSKVRLPRVNNRRDRVVTQAEYRRLLRAVSGKAPHLRPILILGYETGMRLGEILGLTWPNLSRRRGFAYLRDTKNGTHRWVPLNASCRAALREWPRRTDTDLVFAGRSGEHLTSLKTAWREVCGRAKVRNARFHDLRHTFTTRMLEAGVDIRSIMAITGHKSVTMFQRYSHPSDAHLKAAVESLHRRPDPSNLGTVADPAAGSARKSLKGL